MVSSCDDYVFYIEEQKRTIDNLKQDRDHWQLAYCKAEQETARMEAWATKLFDDLERLKKHIEPVFDLHNEISAHLILTQIKKD